MYVCVFYIFLLWCAHELFIVFQDVGPPSLANLFLRGQLLPCYVLTVDGGRVSLSLNPRLVNSHLTHTDIKSGMVREM